MNVFCFYESQNLQAICEEEKKNFQRPKFCMRVLLFVVKRKQITLKVGWCILLSFCKAYIMAGLGLGQIIVNIGGVFFFMIKHIVSFAYLFKNTIHIEWKGKKTNTIWSYHKFVSSRAFLKILFQFVRIGCLLLLIGDRVRQI